MTNDGDGRREMILIFATKEFVLAPRWVPTLIFIGFVRREEGDRHLQS